MINIPSNEQPNIRQSNKSNRQGNIVESFNLDLNENHNGVRVTRSKVSVSENTLAGFQDSAIGIPGISSFNSELTIFSGKNPSLVITGGNSAYDTFSTITTGFTPNPNYCDVIQFNGRLWGTSSDDIYYTADNDTWSAMSASLNSNSPHLLAVLGNRMYVSNNQDQVDTVDSSNTYAGTGTGTIDLDLSGYTISILMSGNDRVWIGVMPTGTNDTTQFCWVYEWDGESTNAPTRKYKIDAPAIFAGCMKDDVPYIMDCYGRLLAYNGNTFIELDRLPLKRGQMLRGVGSIPNNFRSIHPRGMTVHEGEIVVNVSNRIENSDSTPRFADFASGIWAYNPNNGFYHKYSSSYVTVDSTSETDYGQSRVEEAGVIYSYSVNNPTTTEGGSLLWSAKIFEDANSAQSDGIWALFVDDTIGTTKKAGYFITSEIHSSKIDDQWQSIHVKYKKLLNSADKIVVKYRIDNTYDDIEFAWTDTNRLQTNGDLSNYTIGDEIHILQGTGGGKSAHIKSIETHGGGYTVVVDDTFTGATGTCVGRVSKFKKAGDVDFTDERQIKQLTANVPNHWIQFKVHMEWTGDNELDGITITNKDNIK